MAKWSEQVNVYTSADAVAPTLGALVPAGAQLRTNTDTAWANQPLRVFANNGVIQSVISPYGGHYRIVSDTSLVAWGGYSSEEVLVAYSRSDAGEPEGHRIYLVVSSDDFANFSEFIGFARAITSGPAGEFTAGLTVYGSNATNVSSVTLGANSISGSQLTISLDGVDDSQIIASCHPTTGLSVVMTGFSAQTAPEAFRIDDEIGPVTAFSPFVADGALAVGYVIDTSNTLAHVDARVLSVRNNTAPRLEVSGTAAAGQTALLLYDQDNGTLERVTVGIADSGGAGFKVLRIPN
jgi:hypothetical protein